MSIREATTADLPALVVMGQKFRATTAYAALIAENPTQMHTTAERLIAQDDGCVFVAERRDGSISGMLGALIFDHHLSGEKTVGEVFLWSENGHGRDLVRRAERWAHARGAVLSQLVQPYGETRVGQLYTALGYYPIETAWQKSLGPSGRASSVCGVSRGPEGD